MRNEVGARRTQKTIQANPMATADDLAWLREQNPVAALQHPNCPPGMWWELAADYPIEAMSSTLYWMLTLESPERWEQLERGCLFTWMKHAIARLPFRERELFASDCAERVLCLYEREHPNDTRARDAIEARRRYANGQLSQEGWAFFQEEAQNACAYAQMTRCDIGIVKAIHSTCEEAIEMAAHDAGWAVAVDVAARWKETTWQWRRALQYLCGEVG